MLALNFPTCFNPPHFSLPVRENRRGFRFFQTFQREENSSLGVGPARLTNSAPGPVTDLIDCHHGPVQQAEQFSCDPPFLGLVPGAQGHFFLESAYSQAPAGILSFPPSGPAHQPKCNSSTPLKIGWFLALLYRPLPYGGLLVSFHLLGEAPSLPLNSASLSALRALGTAPCVGMVSQLAHLCNAVFPLTTIDSP